MLMYITCIKYDKCLLNVQICVNNDVLLIRKILDNLLIEYLYKIPFTHFFEIT